MAECELFCAELSSLPALIGVEVGSPTFRFNARTSRGRNGAEVSRTGPVQDSTLSVRTQATHIQLLRFKKGDDVELEFFLPSGLMIFFPDCVFGDVEWTDGVSSRKVFSSRPDVIAFNPSHERLRLRVRTVKYEFQVLVVTIESALLGRVLDGCGDIPRLDLQQRVGLEAREVAQTLRRICDELRCPGTYLAPYLDGLVTLALAALMRSLSADASLAGSMRASGGLPAWRLKRAMELLEDSQADALTLDEVARPLRLHPSSFCRAFKKSTGLTPHRYLLLCRVNRAKQMMRDSDRTLTEIALDCGFNSSSQFSVVFKRIEGLSPRSFRRSMACTRDAALPQRQLAAEQMHQVLSIPQTQICAPSNGEPRRLTNV